MVGRGLYHLMRGAAVASEAIDGAHKGATWSRPRLLVRGEGLQIDGPVASFAWAGLAGLAGAKVPEDWYEVRVASVYGLHELFLDNGRPAVGRGAANRPAGASKPKTNQDPGVN